MADEKQSGKLQEPNWDFEKFKNSDEFKDIKRNRKGQFVPNNEQLRTLVKYEEIKLSEIDTSEVTDMSLLFCRYTHLPTEKQNKIGNPQRKDFSGIDKWNTSRVTTFEGMFQICSEFNENISGWDTSSAKSFKDMFWGASEFNQPIGKWNTSSVTNMYCMFFDALNFNQALNEWDTSNVTNMNGMFQFTRKFNQDLSAWGDKLGNLQDISEMFLGTEALNVDFLNSWEIPNHNIVDIVVESCGIEYNEKGQFLPNDWELRILVKYEEIKLYEIDTSKITNMECLFKSDYENGREDFEGIEGWDTSKVTTFTAMFMEASEFNEDISGWDTSSAKSFDFMFCGAWEFNQPIGKWDTSSATSMVSMFSDARAFNQNINDWDVSNVSDFTIMFSIANNFNQPLDKWDVSNAVGMQGMFASAISFNQDLSAWGNKLGKMRDMSGMFAYAKALTINFLDSWNIPDDCDTDEMKKGSGLENVDLETNTQKSTLTLYNYGIFENKNINYKNIERNKKIGQGWLSDNIKNEFKIFLVKKDKYEFVSGDENDWEFAYCEIFEYCFEIKRYKANKRDGDFCIMQGRTIDDFKGLDKSKESEFKPFGKYLRIYFEPKNIYIINTYDNQDSNNPNNIVLNTLTAMVLARAYNAKMRKLENKASKNDNNPKELQACYTEVCNFDLNSYRSVPVTENVANYEIFREIWKNISDACRVGETHDELKEAITQMSRVLTDKKKDKQSWWFSIAAMIIALVSLLVAVISAVPVIEKLLG